VTIHLSLPGIVGSCITRVKLLLLFVRGVDLGGAIATAFWWYPRRWLGMHSLPDRGLKGFGGGGDELVVAPTARHALYYLYVLALLVLALET
jgi:hypothetical protein